MEVSCWRSSVSLAVLGNERVEMSRGLEYKLYIQSKPFLDLASVDVVEDQPTTTGQPDCTWS